MHKASIKILSVAALNSTLTTSTLIIFHFPYQKTVRLILFNLCGFEFNLFCNSLVTYELLCMSTYLLKPFSEETLTAKTICSKYYFHLLQRQSLFDIILMWVLILISLTVLVFVTVLIIIPKIFETERNITTFNCNLR